MINLKRLIMPVLTTALFMGVGTQSAKASQYVDVSVKGSEGPYAVCIGSLEGDRIFAGYVTKSGNIPLAVPHSDGFLEKGDMGIIVTGPSGTVNMPLPKETLTLTVNMSRAEPIRTRCSVTNAVEVEMANRAFFDGLMDKIEEGDKRLLRRTDPSLLLRFVREQQGRSLEMHQKYGVSAVVRGEIFEAIAKDQKRREDIESARAMIERVMAALAAQAREAEREADAKRREREAAEAEWRRNEANVSIPKEEAPEPVGHECFGAVGQGCKKMTIWFDGVKGSTCKMLGADASGKTFKTCWVNSGSWAHDECCAANPNGVMCGGNGSSNLCQAEWDHAWDHTAGMLYTWTNIVDTTILDYDGKIDHDKFCAPFASILDHDEGPTYCCSKKALQPFVFNPLTWSWAKLPSICKP